MIINILFIINNILSIFDSDPIANAIELICLQKFVQNKHYCVQQCVIPSNNIPVKLYSRLLYTLKLPIKQKQI